MDRCESETVYDVLVSLKTFMENDQCVYIIPCDDQALQSHIESIDQEGGYFGDQDGGVDFEIRQNAREFLRKFFQTHIRIPPFIEEDIEKYAESKTEELEEEFGDDVLDVITKAYVKNPRRIKQSLNQLTTLRMLAHQMEDAGHLDEGTLTDNLDFLAKIMVLQEDYQTFYRELQNNPRLLEDVNDYFRADLDNDQRKRQVEELLGKGLDSSEGESRLEEFLRSTLQCRVDNPEPFLQLGEPSFASELSDHESFLQNLRTNQVEEIRAELETVQEGEQLLDPYLRAIDDRLDDYITEARYSPLFSTINTLLSVFENFDEDNQRKVAELLGRYIALEPVQGFLSDFDPDEFFPVLLEIPGDNQDTVFQRFASVVVSDDGLRKSVLEAFVRNADSVPRDTADQLSDTLLRLDESELVSALEVLSRTEASKQLATSDLLEWASSQVTWDNNSNQFEGTEFYTQFDSQAEPRARQHFVNRLLDLRNLVDDSQQDENTENQYYNQLQRSLKQLDGQVSIETGNRLFSELKQRVSSESGQSVDFVKVVIDFYPSYDAGTRSEFSEWIAGLIGQWNQGNVQQIINHSENQEVDLFRDEDVVDNALSRIPDTLGNSGFIVNTLIPAISEKHDERVSDLIRRLSENSDHTQNLIAAEIFAKYPKRFEEVQETVLDRCREQIANADNADQKRIYLEAEAVVYDELENAEREGFINRLDTLLSGDQSDHQAFQDIWSDIENKLESERRTSVARNLRGQFQSEISGNIQPNQLFPLVDIFRSLAESGDVDEEDGNWMIERLTDQFEGSNLNDNQISTLIEKLAAFPEYYGEEDQTLTRIESLLNNNNDDRVHNNAEKLIDSLEKAGNLDRERIEDVRDRLNI